jgi:hypothetical protein
VILRTGDWRHEQSRQTNCKRMTNDSHLTASVNVPHCTLPQT